MTCLELFRQLSKVETVFAQVDASCKRPTTSIEEQAHLARYLCVLVCGTLEMGIRSLFSDYSSRRSGASAQITNYVESQLRCFINPKTGKILQLIGNFDPLWREQFENFIDGKIKDHIDSVVHIRHQIAHGQDATITLGTMNAYYDSVKKALQKLETILGL